MEVNLFDHVLCYPTHKSEINLLIKIDLKFFPQEMPKTQSTYSWFHTYSTMYPSISAIIRKKIRKWSCWKRWGRRQTSCFETADFFVESRKQAKMHNQKNALNLNEFQSDKLKRQVYLRLLALKKSKERIRVVAELY